ncbi:MAG: right-handed parallel beta-helix repeat-containing protein, partial [Elusimicrobiota bacterium]
MRRLPWSEAAKDSLVQMFSLLAALSGLMTAHCLWTRPALKSASVAAPLIPGRWVVDSRRAPGSDRGSLAEALAGAREGDVIELAPGAYAESPKTTKSVTILGRGKTSDEVVISGSGPDSDWALGVDAGRLTLRNLSIRSAANAVRVAGGDLDVEGCSLEGRVALAVSGRSRLRVERSTLTGRGDNAAVSAEGEGASLIIEQSTISNGAGSGLAASRLVLVRLRDVSVSRNALAALTIRSGAEVRVKGGKISENRQCG